MKSYTDIEQSKKLAEFLPLKSVDMYWDYTFYEQKYEYRPMVMDDQFDDVCIPAWSLSALLDILPDRTCVYKKTYKDGRVKYKGVAEGIKELILKDNPIDACVEIIIKLHKLNLL